MEEEINSSYANLVKLQFIEKLGHKSPKTTEIYTHVSQTALRKIVSTLDSLNLKEVEEGEFIKREV
ncbi:MAG: hypothetical protein ACE5KT_04600 [Methanosarcinales archaeon]